MDWLIVEQHPEISGAIEKQIRDKLLTGQVLEVNGDEVEESEDESPEPEEK